MAAAAAFNLICSGTGLTVVGTGPSAKTTSDDFTMVYRIDLDGRRYCMDKCESTSQLEAVTDTELVFKYLNNSETLASFVKVNRESGAYLSTIKIGSFTSMRSGTCVPAPFTGFPARKF
ncbi:hypothetical protein ATE69_05515 [Sphingopyxis sp. H071]|nr:hypothetical protein ATE69_05515 [Sphingopyxis sp. H071]